MNMRDNGAFGKAHNIVPIVGQADQPIMMQVGCVLTPALKTKLENWMQKTGMPVAELGNTVLRLGLIALSFQIDLDDERITNPEELLP